MSKAYRITFFDKNNIRPNIEKVVYAEAKYLAVEAARAELHETADQRIEFITCGIAGTVHEVVNHKGKVVKCRVLDVSPEYYNVLLDECWGIAEVMQCKGVAKGQSSASTVAKAEAALQANHAACESEQQGDSGVIRRKKRWSRAQKRAAAESRAKAAGLSLVA